MRQPTRPIMPHAVLNALRLNLLQLRQPHGIGVLNRDAFEVAWGQFGEWRETSAGLLQIGVAKAIALEEGDREVTLDPSLTSDELVRRELRFRCVEGPVLHVRDLAPEIHAEFATFAFWQTARNPEAEWRRYSSYPAVLRSLRSMYVARLSRTPIGERVLGVLHGDPAMTESFIGEIVRILRFQLGGLEASIHPDSHVRREETEQILRCYVLERLTVAQSIPWTYWIADLLDGRVLSPLVARAKVTDAFRKSRRVDRWLACRDEGDSDDDGAIPEEQWDVPVYSAELNRPARAWIDSRAGRGSASVVDAYLRPGRGAMPSQRDVASRVGVSPRTVSSRLQAIRSCPELKARIREMVAD